MKRTVLISLAAGITFLSLSESTSVLTGVSLAYGQVRTIDRLTVFTDAAKRFKTVKNATAVIWKMRLVAERAFRRVKHPELMPQVSRGITFVDGVEEKTRVAA